jgi:hypothetical protein
MWQRSMAAPGSAPAELSPAPADARRLVSKPLALAASYPICRLRHEARRSRVRLAFANRSSTTVFLPIPPGEPASPMGSLCSPFSLENTPMARPTAPSLWLPGFDPAAPALPRPAKQVCLSVSCDPAGPVEVIHVENLSDVEQEQFVATVRANWRVVATATEAAPRILWPQLTRADLEHLTGPSAKFEANLAAITLLRRSKPKAGRPVRMIAKSFSATPAGAACPPASTSKGRQRLGRTRRACSGLLPPRTTNRPAPRSTTATTPRST